MKYNIKKYIMPVIGFIMLAVNAIGYVFNAGIKHPGLTVIGLVFVTIGMRIARKNNA
jgi:hypothetical protein